VGCSSVDISGRIPIAEYPSSVCSVGNHHLAIYRSSSIHVRIVHDCHVPARHIKYLFFFLQRTRWFADSFYLLSVFETASCVTKKFLWAQKRIELGVEKTGCTGHRSEDDQRFALFDSTNGASASIIFMMLNSSIISQRQIS